MSAGSRSGVNWIRSNERVDGPGQRLHQERLGQARQPFHQNVAADQQRDHQPVHDRLLTDHRTADLLAKTVDDLVGVADGLFRFDLVHAPSV